MNAVPSAMRLIAGRTIIHLATVYATLAEALAQLLENSFDAGARNVLVELGTESVEIIDDGSGLNDYMSEPDRSCFDAWLAEEAQGVPFEVLLQGMALSSRQSLEMMMRSIALSTKQGKGALRGEKGIGALAWLMFGTKATVITRPAETVRGAALREGQSFVLHPPILSQLERNDMGYKIETQGAPYHFWVP